MKTTAYLVYDSSYKPSPNGVRSGGATPRHVLYQAGSFVLDLYLEVIPNSNRISLMGQVLHYRKPQDPVSNVPVILVNDKDHLEQTSTNEHGEFSLELEPDKNHRLSVVVNDKRIVVIPSSSLQRRSAKNNAD